MIRRAVLAALVTFSGCAVPDVEVQGDASTDAGADDATTEGGPADGGAPEAAGDDGTSPGRDAASDGGGGGDAFCNGNPPPPDGGCCTATGTPCYGGCMANACNMCKCDAGTVCCTHGGQGDCKPTCP
jgi:hypothetical protein